MRVAFFVSTALDFFLAIDTSERLPFKTVTKIGMRRVADEIHRRPASRTRGPVIRTEVLALLYLHVGAPGDGSKLFGRGRTLLVQSGRWHYGTPEIAKLLSSRVPYIIRHHVSAATNSMASVSDRPRNRLHNRLADRGLEILSRVCLFVRQTDQRHSFFLFRRFKAASGSGSKRDTPFANIRRSNFCAVLLSCSSGSSSSTLQGGDCQGFKCNAWIWQQ